MKEDVRRYLAEIGRRGGKRSRRTLDPKTARQMVRLREARRAFRRFHARCFWSSPRDYAIGYADLPWVAQRLMTYGGRQGWHIGSRLYPLTEFQEAIARRLAANRSSDSYLVGGAALHIEPNSKRYSNDLDYFQDSEQRVASAFASDERLLVEAGYEVEVLLRQPGFIRALARRDGGVTKIDWAHDSAWRFLPPVKSERAGFTLHPIDLAINKLLALVGRDEPRDYIDVHEAISHILPLGALCWAASGKDPGYTPPLLLELLRRRGKYRPEDFARLALTEPVDLPALKRRWLDALDGAERFFTTRDPEEVGCLYYARAAAAFVEPVPGQEAVPHYPRPGGVLPVLSPDAP